MRGWREMSVSFTSFMHVSCELQTRTEPLGRYVHDWIRCKSLLRLGSENSQFTKGVSSEFEARCARLASRHKVGELQSTDALRFNHENRNNQTYSQKELWAELLPQRVDCGSENQPFKIEGRWSWCRCVIGTVWWEWTRKQPWKTLGRTPNGVVLLLLNSTTEGRHFLQSWGSRFNSQTFDL